jgi:hypothetical protein
MQFGSESFSLNIACTLYTYDSTLIRMLLAENVELRYRRLNDCISSSTLNL